MVTAFRPVGGDKDGVAYPVVDFTAGVTLNVEPTTFFQGGGVISCRG